MFAKDGVEELESTTEWLAAAAAVDDEKRIISLLFSLCIMEIRGMLKEINDRSAKFSSSFDTSSLSKSTALDCGSCKVPVYIYELSCM